MSSNGVSDFLQRKTRDPFLVLPGSGFFAVSLFSWLSYSATGVGLDLLGQWCPSLLFCSLFTFLFFFPIRRKRQDADVHIYTPTGFFDFLGMGNGIRDIAGGVRVFSHEIYLARKQNEQDYRSLRKLSLRIHSTVSMLTVILMSF